MLSCASLVVVAGMRVVVAGRVVGVGLRVVLGDADGMVVAAGSEGLHEATIRPTATREPSAIRRIRHFKSASNSPVRRGRTAP